MSEEKKLQTINLAQDLIPSMKGCIKHLIDVEGEVDENGDFSVNKEVVLERLYKSRIFQMRIEQLFNNVYDEQLDQATYEARKEWQRQKLNKEPLM